MPAMLSGSAINPLRHGLILLIGTTLIASLALSAIRANASELVVKYDQSQLLRIDRPVSEIIIGNPSIADVSIQSKQLLVVTGKSFGKTNIILLDTEKNVIREQLVVVQQDQTQVVNLHRGGARESYNCSPRCNPTITVGDDKVYFKTIAENAQLKMKLSSGAGR
jgi:hypothetical protein